MKFILRLDRIEIDKLIESYIVDELNIYAKKEVSWKYDPTTDEIVVEGY